MKQCSYCGAEYPDDATVCAIDENPLVDIKAATTVLRPAAKMTWLDKQFLDTSSGFWGYKWNFALTLSIIGVLGCKHPTARKNAWILLGWQLGILALVVVILIIFGRR